MNGTETFLTTETTSEILVLKLWNLTSSDPIKNYTISKEDSFGEFFLA